MWVLPHSKSSEARAFAAAALLLGATSLAQAAAPLGHVVGGGLSPAHSEHSPRGVMLNLSTASITPTIALHPPQRLDEPRQALAGLHDLSVRTRGIDVNEEGRSRVAFKIHWHDNPDIVSPQVASLVRNFRHSGLPIVHLWQSGRNLLAIGLNPHGKPGIYFTQKLPD